MMLNPFAAWPISPRGTWEDHADYSEGGTDYPTPYDTLLAAPAAGVLIDNGWVGTAGRRATLRLDTPIQRVTPASRTLMSGGRAEAEGPMVAICFQHLSERPVEGHYAEDEPGMVRTGASANGVDYGGDVHCHVHGYDANGYRLDFTKFLGTSTAGGAVRPITTPTEATIMDLLFCKDNNGPLWTLVDHSNRVFAQTRDQGRANLWAILYRPDKTARDINSPGNLAYLTGGAYKSQTWPFTHATLND